MSFEYIALIIFFIVLSFLLYLKRKNLVLQKIFFPFLYFAMYKSDFGLSLMDSSAKRFKLFWRIFGFLGIVVGCIFMVVMPILLLKSLYDLLLAPQTAAGVALVLPIPVDSPGIMSVPPFYWLISIFIIAVVHEFAHGVMARVHNIHVKSTGFAFLGIIVPVIPAAFVEPDEKVVKKKSLLQQLSVFGAGAFANIVLALIVFGVLALLIPFVSSNIVDDAGVMVVGFSNSSPAELAGVELNSLIVKIDDAEILSDVNYSSYLSSKKPGDTVVVFTNVSSHKVVLASHPLNDSKPYLGLFVVKQTVFNKGFEERYGSFSAHAIVWFVGLLIWLYVLNLGIGLFNLLPLGPIDGGRMFLAILTRITDEAKAMAIFSYVSFAILAVLLASLLFSFF